jgi:hypothetical protein
MFNTNHHHINNTDKSDNSVSIVQPISGTFLKSKKKSFIIDCTIGDNIYKNIFSYEPKYTFTSKSEFKEIRDYNIQWHGKDIPATKQIPITKTIDVELVQFMLMNDNKISVELIEKEPLKISVKKYTLTETEQKIYEKNNN